MAAKMRACKSCGAEIASSAKACPQCGARNKGLPLAVTILIVVLLLFGLIACGVASCTGLFVASVDDAVQETSQGSDIVGPDGQTLTGEAAKTATFPIGSEITVGDLVIKVDAPENRKPGEYDSVKSGNVAVFHVTATNKSESPAYISSGDFNLYVDGTKIDEAFTTDVNFIVDQINTGKTAEGDMAFDLKSGSKFELVYTPNFLTEQQITFEGAN
ncbi:MAG: DUF4352 domain-containing protein [Coriobacteriia bacterium]|nr:DUF4352 domain-containing protein [Coriobacteriia bacterium]